MTPMIEPQPSIAMDMAIRIIQRKNLKDLWVISSALSCLNIFGFQYATKDNNHNFAVLIPTLEPEFFALFNQAIIKSKAAEYKDENFEFVDFKNIKNYLSDASYRDKLADETSSYAYNLFSRIGNVQIRFQKATKDFLENVGRFYQLYINIPVEHRKELQHKFKNKYIDIGQFFQDNYGISISEFFIFGFLLWSFYGEKYNGIILSSENIRKTIENPSNLENIDQQLSFVNQVLNLRGDIHKNFVFYEDFFTSRGIDLAKANAYIKIVAGTTKKLRALVSSSSIYSKGYYPDRLSPLERFPIVELDDHSFTIPNLYYFIVGITELLHYILQEDRQIEIYSQMMGYIQELYIIKVVKEAVNHITIIPETPYRKQSEFSGPDVTIIENQTNRMIVIESKSRRLRAITRVDPTDENLHENWEDVFNAFDKIPVKIDDMYAGYKEYAFYQEIINKTNGHPKLVVVVIGQGGFLHSEQFNNLIKHSTSDRRLNDYPYPYCMIDLQTLEHALNVVSSNKNLSLYDLLLEYSEDSKEFGFKQDLAESFRGRTRNPQDSITLKYANDLFNELSKIYNSNSG